MIPKAEALTAAIADMQRDLTQHSSHLRRSQPPLHPQKLRPESRAATRANALLGNWTVRWPKCPGDRSARLSGDWVSVFSLVCPGFARRWSDFLFSRPFSRASECRDQGEGRSLGIAGNGTLVARPWTSSSCQNCSIKRAPGRTLPERRGLRGGAGTCSHCITVLRFQPGITISTSGRRAPRRPGATAGRALRHEGPDGWFSTFRV